MANEPGYLIVIQKVTSLSGESIQVSTNLPKDSTTEDFEAEINKICEALDNRLVKQNDRVLENTKAMREAYAQLGIDGHQPPLEG